MALQTDHHPQRRWEYDHQVRGKLALLPCWGWWRCIWRLRDLFLLGFLNQTDRWAWVDWCCWSLQSSEPYWRWSLWGTSNHDDRLSAQLHNLQVALPWSLLWDYAWSMRKWSFSAPAWSHRWWRRSSDCCLHLRNGWIPYPQTTYRQSLADHRP